MLEVFFYIKFDHFKIRLLSKINRQFCFEMDFFARVNDYYKYILNPKKKYFSSCRGFEINFAMPAKKFFLSLNKCSNIKTL